LIRDEEMANIRPPGHSAGGERGHSVPRITFENYRMEIIPGLTWIRGSPAYGATRALERDTGATYCGPSRRREAA